MNTLPTDSLALEQKIWRYMDLNKFVLLLTRQALYFPCLTELDDPYEGYMPKSHAKAMAEVLEKTYFGPHRALRPHFEAQSEAQAVILDEIAEQVRQKISYREMRRNFAVNCWHANDKESEAMWKIYSAFGSGIAIESTVERLRDVLLPYSGVNINRVQYEDFDTAQIEKGRTAYFLLSKRPSFEYEHEVRATCKLDTPDKGIELKCDLTKLIVRVYVSPSASPVFLQSIQELCSGLVHGLRLEVVPSQVFAEPTYDLNRGLDTD